MFAFKYTTALHAAIKLPVETTLDGGDIISYPVKNTSFIKLEGLVQGGGGVGPITIADPPRLQLFSTADPSKLQLFVVVVVVVELVDVVDVLDVVVVVGIGPSVPTIASRSSQHPLIPE